MCKCMETTQTKPSPMEMSMRFARKRITKERDPIKLNLSSHRIGAVKAGKSMKSGKPRAPHSVIS